MHQTKQVKPEPSSMVVSADVPFPSADPRASRVLSALEFLLGVFIVIGHNVFHIVPNEVIILSILGLISIPLRGYLLTRAADIGRRSAPAYWIGIVPVSILFGYGALLQRRIWCDRFRRCRVDFGNSLHAGGPQPLGQHFRSRIY